MSPKKKTNFHPGSANSILLCCYVLVERCWHVLTIYERLQFANRKKKPQENLRQLSFSLSTDISKLNLVPRAFPLKVEGVERALGTRLLQTF